MSLHDGARALSGSSQSTFRSLARAMSPPNRYRQPSLSEGGSLGSPYAAFGTATAACDGESGHETVELARDEPAVIEDSAIRVLLVDDHPVVRTGLDRKSVV